MSLSETLLLIAALTAVLPILSLGLRPPSSIRDLEKTFVVGMVTVGVGAIITSQTHHLNVFAVMHLWYLLGVVTIPALLGGWWLTALARRRRTRLLRVGAVFAVVIALCGAWGTHIEPNWLRTDIVAVTAPVSQPISIGVLADLQTPNVGKHEWNAVNTLLEQQPDLVLIPGDLFQGPPDQIQAAMPDFVALLTALTEQVDHVAVVSGDSDWVGQLLPMTHAAGALFIDNTTSELTIRGQRIRLAGVSVNPAGGDRLNTIAGLIDQSDAMTVLLSHRPDVVFELAPSSDVDLIVSGHTHGGQITLPFIGPPVTFSSVPRSLAAGGIGLVENYPVYISTGVGLERHAAPQVRFGARPSVGIINVVPP